MITVEARHAAIHEENQDDMPDARTSRCELCQHDIETHRITLHLKSCIRKHVTYHAENQAYEISSAPPRDWLCHIRIRSQEPDDLHRLHLLAHPNTVLADLDQTIRRPVDRALLRSRSHQQFHQELAHVPV